MEKIETNTLDKANTIVGSPNRAQIVLELQKSGTVHRDDLRATCEASRTTLQRNLDTLQEMGWVANSNRTYELTAEGGEVTAELLDLFRTIEITDRLQPFLKWVPDDTFDLELQLLADAELFVPEPGDPYAMINRHVAKIQDMETGYALLPFTGLHATEAAHDQVVQEGATGELVVDSNVADIYTDDPRYAELHEAMVETGRWQVFVYNRPIPYAINIIDDTVQLIAAEDGEPRAMLQSNAESVREWAKHTYNEYKAQATPLASKLHNR